MRAKTGMPCRSFSEGGSPWGLELRAEAKFARTKTGRFPAKLAEDPFIQMSIFH